MAQWHRDPPCAMLALHGLCLNSPAIRLPLNKHRTSVVCAERTAGGPRMEFGRRVIEPIKARWNCVAGSDQAGLSLHDRLARPEWQALDQLARAE